jgi:hypothetical protein
VNRDKRTPQAGLILEAVEALLHEAGSPLADRDLVDALSCRDLLVGAPLSAGQHDAAALGQRLALVGLRAQRSSVARSSSMSISSALGRPLPAIDASHHRRHDDTSTGGDTTQSY